MKNKPFNAKSFGIVIQMPEDFYSKDVDENMVRHIPIGKDDILLGLFKYLYDKKIGIKNSVNEIVIGHEHGLEKGKCHMQMCISFSNKIRNIIKPDEFEFNGNTLLFITQNTKKNFSALKNYCKKSGDYLEIYYGKPIKEILREKGVITSYIDTDDPYDVLFNNPNLSEKQISDVFKSCPITEFKKDFFVNSSKIYDTYARLLKEDKKVESFSWKFPEYMKEYISDCEDIIKDKKGRVFTKLYTWFKTYCEKEGEYRRKALFLFSLRGGLGKSYFSRGLVPEISVCNSPYYVYCRGSLDAGEFLKKSNTARLVILDDVNYIRNDLEIWKALAVGEPTNIRSPYHNTPWMKSLPCILMSNNIKTLQYWLESPELKSRCIFVGIDFYIGPPGSDLEENHICDKFLCEEIEQKLDSMYTSSEVNNCCTI